MIELKMKRKIISWLLGVAGLFLTSCGDIYENLNLGEWHSGGNKNIPQSASSQEEIKFVTIRQGNGGAIGAGSLVHAEVAQRYLPGVGEGFRRGRVHIWFWLGDHNKIPKSVDNKWGELIDLGSEAVRAAFVGTKKGAIVSLTITGKTKYPMTLLPTEGLILNDHKGPEEFYGMGEKIEYQFKIIDVCTGRLLYRQGQLTQGGWRPRLWAEYESKPLIRNGLLEWAAIEADCDGPKDWRVEKGPVYRPKRDELARAWTRDYKSAVAKGKIVATREMNDPRKRYLRDNKIQGNSAIAWD